MPRYHQIWLTTNDQADSKRYIFVDQDNYLLNTLNFDRMLARLLLLCCLLSVVRSHGSVRLPALVGDRMVLQRNTVLKVWGWANRGEKITVSFLNQRRDTKADAFGKWMVQLDPMAAGGPYSLVVKGNNTITLKDILVGDVWLCGGQSNMGWKLSWGVNNNQQEIATANYPQIRLFGVKEVLSYQVQDDVQTEKGWQYCSPSTVGNFSAVAYFFGRQLFNQYQVPIGLISSNWGGSPAEAWMSADALKKVPAYKADLDELQSLDKAGLQHRFVRRLQQWVVKNKENDKGFGDIKWYQPGLPIDGWNKITLPGLWENSVLPDYNGSVWFRKEIQVEKEELGGSVKLSLGHPDDMDSTWVNGVLIGGKQGNALRVYEVPDSVLKEGKNTIVIRVVDYGAEGGIDGKPEEMYLSGRNQTKRIPLEGEWFYRSGDGGNYTAGWPPRAPEENMSELTVLYNSMIAPVTNYALKGIIFYQGEANVNRAEDYLPLFTALIADWRTKWNQNLPFIFAQLSTFLPPPILPEQSKWAQLREAQLKALALVPNTAMAVTIDIGSKDVHPKNKQDVGRRLALAARKLAYGEDIVSSGPIYSHFKQEGNKIRIFFTETGSGLVAKDRYGYLKAFAIAEQNGTFKWAKAVVEGNTVIVWNDEIERPWAVRYGWAANPEDVNLYNKEGLPASPFRTDP